MNNCQLELFHYFKTTLQYSSPLSRWNGPYTKKNRYLYVCDNYIIGVYNTLYEYTNANCQGHQRKRSSITTKLLI